MKCKKDIFKKFDTMANKETLIYLKRMVYVCWLRRQIHEERMHYDQRRNFLEQRLNNFRLRSGDHTQRRLEFHRNVSRKSISQFFYYIKLALVLVVTIIFLLFLQLLRVVVTRNELFWFPSLSVVLYFVSNSSISSLQSTKNLIGSLFQKLKILLLVVFLFNNSKWTFQGKGNG